MQLKTSIFIEVAPGELIDKITILEIKIERIKGVEKLANIRFELDSLVKSRDAAINDMTPELKRLGAELKFANEALWEIEDDIRDCERDKNFGNTFIQLARNVYISNDKRANLKRKINELLGSCLIEEKSYANY